MDGDQRAVSPASVGARIRARWAEGEGPRPARAAARDAVLPVARVAEDRSDVRAAARRAAVREARLVCARRVRSVSELSAPSPAVSVIVPTFDRLPLLRETIASVLDQTYEDLELIVVDDGSTDGTAPYGEGIADRRGRLLGTTPR